MNRLRHALLALVSACALAAFCGCADDPGAEVGAADWIAHVRSAHAAADEALRQGQVQAAIDRLQRALAVDAPDSVQPEHLRVVRQDLLFRVAQAQLRAGRSGEALVAAERGLALGRAVDPFTANLLIARGQALEAAARDTEAAASYHEALEISRALLDAALGRTDAGGP